MNKTYRIVWSQSRRAWVVASELARSAAKRPSVSRTNKGLLARGLLGALFALVSPQSWAGTYSASSEAELRQAIIDANADADPTAAITLTADVSVSSSTAFAAFTKSITIHTNGFTLAGQSGVNPGGRLEFSGNTLAVMGVGGFRGGDALDGTANLDGGTALLMTNGSVANGASITGGKGGDNFVSGGGGLGGVGVSVTNGSVTNDGSITGGLGGIKTAGALGLGGNGGNGVVVTTGSLTNNGTITGGEGGENSSGIAGAGRGGLGVVLSGGSLINNGTIRGGLGGLHTTSGSRIGGNAVSLTNGSLVNNGTIETGPGILGAAGSGVGLNGISTLTNSGTIRGSSSPGVAPTLNSQAAVSVGQNADGTITNTGTIEGGTGGGAITATPFGTSHMTVINSGTIRAGAGQVTAIRFANSASSTSILELHAGSVIEGNVLGNVASANDILRLDGTASSSFAVSAIGATGQYRDFNVFQKTNTSTWTLTGTTTAVVPWQLLAGTLSVSSDGNLGDAAGALTFSGGTLRNTAAFTDSRSAMFSAADGKFQTDADLTWAGMISGNGALTKSGNGSLILSGDNAYTGATNVTAGTLRVNGDQSTATGLTTIASGATLGGDGTIGGAVTIADGGHLAPGNSPGTLSMGTLTLNAGSMLDFELGEANVAGGSLNDLIKVSGDLTLDGTLNVTPSAGGTYGAGIYRLIDYTGTLTNNELELGLLPAGSVNYIQTSIAHQINLINTHGLEFSYWDGPSDARDNAVIGGGSGIWLAASNDNWVTADGTFNMAYLDATVAAFAGTAGTVTVDATMGAIRVAGMQFASDGYRLEGDAVTLITGLNAVRVGDGTPAGAAFSATIASALTGDGALDKTDLGTLVLTAGNSYAGGTTISAGTLALSGAGTLPAGSDVVANGTFDISATNAGASIRTLTGSGAVVLGAQALTMTAAEGNFGSVNGAAGTLNKGGAGTWTLTGAESEIGTLNVQSGTLDVIGGASLAANTMTISAGATVRNSGTFNGTSGSDTLSIAGVLAGNASLLDGDDHVQIASGADISQAVFDGGAGVDALELAHDGALTVSNGFATNFERLTKQGTGRLTIAGTQHGFSESITIAAGNAQLAEASVQTNEFRIESGATVSGMGSLSGALMNAGTFSPGNSPGTVHVAGNYTQAAGALLVSEINRGGTDLLDIAGGATLAGTQRIQVEYGLYLDGTTHTLIRAAGGIDGAFDTIEINPSALMSADRQVSANNVAVSFVRQPMTSIVDPNTNGGRYAQLLEEQIATGGLTDGMIAYVDSLLQQPTAAAALGLLGEVAEPTAAVSQGSVSTLGAGYAQAVFDRFALVDGVRCASTQASDALNCAWMRGLRQWGDADGDRFGSSYDWDTDGAQFGFDRQLSSWNIGVTFGHSVMDLSDARGGRNELRSKMGAMYGSYTAGRLGLDALALYSTNENRTRRNVTIGAMAQQARAEFDGDSFGLGARLGYRLTDPARALVRPFAELFYDRIDGSSFTERDAGAGNLSVRIHNREGLRGTLGVQLANDYEGYGHVFRPSLEVGVVHQFEDNQSTLDVQPFGSADSFRAYGVAFDRTSYLAKAALGISLGANAALSIGYSGELADDRAQHEANLGLRIVW